MNLFVENLHKTYDKKAVVDGISFEITSGETIGILGPNGAGKTTLFYMIAGLVAIDSGKIYLSGKELNHKSISENNKIILEGEAFLDQDGFIIKSDLIHYDYSLNKILKSINSSIENNS